MNEHHPAEKSMMETVQRLKNSLSSDNLAIQEIDFLKAMEILVTIETGLTCGEVVSGGTELDLFRREVAGLVKKNEQQWFSFITTTTLNAASESETYGWRQPSLYRSAMKYLCDNYPGVVDDEDLEFIGELDEILRDRAPWIEPLPHDQIPFGIPEGHWWWRMPSWKAKA